MPHFKLEDSVGFVINTAASRIKGRLARAFKTNGFNVSSEHWVVLNCLWEEDGQTQSNIAIKIVKDKTNVTRILDVMTKNKLIERRNHESDRRSFRVFLTEKGKQLKDELIQLAVEVNKECLQGFSADELHILTSLMKRINRNCM